MKITMTLGGSRGDVQPYVALGLGLKDAGHQVRLTAPATFETMIRTHGLDFSPVSLDPQAAVKQALRGGDANLAEFAWRARKILAPIMEKSVREYLDACRDADAVVYTSVGFLGYKISQCLGLPRVGAMYGPLINSSGSFPSSFVPVFSGNLDVPPKSSSGRLYNRLTYTVSQQLMWQLLRSPTNSALRATGELSPFPLDGPFGEVKRRREPMINGWSPRVLPHPQDWGAHLPVTGYWFLDSAESWQPPAGLVDFLKSGPPPVSVGFGSMSGDRAEELVSTILSALKRAGRRGVLISGWGGLGNSDLPDEVFKVDEAPYEWLFPRVTAAVHHGGSGSTAASLRAGVPTIVVSFFADQSFWGARVAGLGAGPPPIPRSRLTDEHLAAAITETARPAMREKARTLGAGISSEKGIERAVEEFHRLLEPRVGAPVR